MQKTIDLILDINRQVEAQCYAMGLKSAQQRALRYFVEHGPASLTEYANQHHLNLGNASMCVSSLSNKGYLTKEGFRGKIYATDKAHEIMEADPVRDLEHALAGLPKEDVDAAERVLKHLGERMKARGE